MKKASASKLRVMRSVVRDLSRLELEAAVGGAINVRPPPCAKGTLGPAQGAKTGTDNKCS